MMRALIVAVALGVLSSSLLLTTACSLSGHDGKAEQIELEKCGKAAALLNIDDNFVTSAISWKRDQLPKQQQAAQDGVRSTVDKAAMQSDGSVDKKTVSDWYHSTYCQALITDYSGFLVSNYSKSLVDKKTLEVPCEAYKKQYHYAYISDSSPLVKTLSDGLRKTIEESTNKLSLLQAGHVDAEISGASLQDFAGEISAQCPDGALLSSSLLRMPSIFFVTDAQVALEELKNNYEKYIADPASSNKSAQENIDKLAEKCKQDGKSRNLGSDDYDKYVKNVCEPTAKAEFIAPQVAMLKKINEQILDIKQKTPPHSSADIEAILKGLQNQLNQSP